MKRILILILVGDFLNMVSTENKKFWWIFTTQLLQLVTYNISLNLAYVMLYLTRYSLVTVIGPNILIFTWPHMTGKFWDKFSCQLKKSKYCARGFPSFQPTMVKIFNKNTLCMNVNKYNAHAVPLNLMTNITEAFVLELGQAF